MPYYLFKLIGSDHQQLGDFKNYMLLYAQKLEKPIKPAVLDLTLENISRKYLDVLMAYRDNFKTLEDDQWFVLMIERMERYGKMRALSAPGNFGDQVLAKITEAIESNLKPEILLPLKSE